MCPNSEQQLIDCNTYSGGCRGGHFTNAWEYLNETGVGLMATMVYPYITDVSKIGFDKLKDRTKCMKTIHLH